MMRGRRLLAARARAASRNRRTMFSMSMMASSTTTPTAITRPARIIVLIVAPEVEHQQRRHQRHRDGDHADQRRCATRRGTAARIDHDQHKPSSSASVRLWIAVSMKSAGRKIVVSMSMPGRPGLHLVDRVLDALRDVERVAPRQLLDDQHEARTVVDDRVADERLVVLLRRSATSPRRRRRAVASLPTATWARSAGVTIGSDVLDAEPLVRRCRSNPPVPMTDAARRTATARRPRASAVASITSSSETSLRRQLGRSACTCIIFSCSPQIATFATPGTRSRRARICPIRDHRHVRSANRLRGHARSS